MSFAKQGLILLVSVPIIGEAIPSSELIFDYRVFGLGRVKFFFAEEDLEAIPLLVF